jgi:type II secretory pathway pseudopilin PulG
MSLEGLRAWIGEVERKLAKRTRVFLALTVIAIGIAGAAIYLAIDARESSVSESDVQALQQELEARIDELGAPSSTAPVEPESEATGQAGQAAPEEPAEPEPKPQTEKKGASQAPEGATGGAASAAKLQELIERAKEQNAQAEEGQGGK